MAITNEEFFKPGISGTSINDYVRSPAHFWKRSSFNAERIKEPPTPAMAFGRLVHCLLLNPEDFEGSFYIMPDVSEFPTRPLISTDDIKDFLRKRGQSFSGKNKPELIKIAKECKPDVLIWDDLIEQHRKKAGRRDVVTVWDYQRATIMRNAAMRNEDVISVLAKGQSEVPLTWYREPGGPMCKARIDRARDDGYVIDYKTTNDAREENFQDDIANYGYHRELAWNAEAVFNHYGVEIKGAIIIAQEKDLPDAINVVALKKDTFAIAKKECDNTYNKIREGLQTPRHVWNAYPKGIKAIGLPGYYKPTYEKE